MTGTTGTAEASFGSAAEREAAEQPDPRGIGSGKGFEHLDDDDHDRADAAESG